MSVKMFLKNAIKIYSISGYMCCITDGRVSTSDSSVYQDAEYNIMNVFFFDWPIKYKNIHGVKLRQYIINFLYEIQFLKTI
jgi:hypothetical protein